MQPLDKDAICLEKVRFVSKKKPRLRAQLVQGVMRGFDAGEREGLVSFGICCGRLISRNSVSEGLEKVDLKSSKTMSEIVS